MHRAAATRQIGQTLGPYPFPPAGDPIRVQAEQRAGTPPSLFATCALPGCNHPVASCSDACGSCQVVFSGYLQPARSGQPVPTEQDLAQRDTDVAAAYAQQHERAATAAPVRRGDPDGEHERRANQRCWLCEGRRTCTRMPRGWECDHCRTIE